MSTKKPCQANNPTTCRYHGSIHVHRKQLAEALTTYKNVMVKQLSAGRVTPEMKTLVQNASDTYWERQAVIDAHDGEYANLKKELADLDYAKEGEDPDSLDDKFKVEYADVKKRIRMAKAVRRASKNEDNPKGLSYAAESGHDLTEAKNYLKSIKGGEFVGVHAGSLYKGNKESVVIVGTEKSYSVTLDKQVVGGDKVYELNDPRTPKVLSSNPALVGTNLRWKANKVPYTDPDNRELKTTKTSGYTVYSEEKSFTLSTEGVIRQSDTLLSLE